MINKPPIVPGVIDFDDISYDGVRQPNPISNLEEALNRLQTNLFQISQYHETQLETNRLLNRFLKESINAHNHEDYQVEISTTMPYIVNYRKYAHIFIYSPTTRTLIPDDDHGNVTLTLGMWTNFPFPEGSRWTDSASTTLIPIFIRCTNEVIP